MTAEHLRLCEDCREIAGEVAHVEHEGLPLLPEPKPLPWPVWRIAVAAAFAGLVFLTFYWIVPGRDTQDRIEELIAAAPQNARFLEARLAGFPWAPVRSTRRGVNPTLDTEQMKLIGAAGGVLEKTKDDPSPQGRHATAVAHLLAGNARQADQVLSSTVTRHGSARMWSDLAATRYTAAVQTGNSAELTQALAAADAALRLDAKLPEALFNRALILEELGLRDQARAAWERYVAVDADSKWATEARAHLQTLKPLTEFREELQKHYAVLQSDRARAEALARRYPQEARVWGETEILARWANALIEGDNAGAEAHLGVARAFAETIAPRGDLMLARAVDAVVRSDPKQRRQLAQAHLNFRTAQQTYRAGQPAAAEPLFEAARLGFEKGGSPVALRASNFRANTMYEQGRATDAATLLQGLFDAAPADYPAHRAHLQWQLGLVHAAKGKWGDAIAALSDSVRTFERLHENGYANTVRDILAEAYDRLGERRLAWRYRTVSLHGISQSDPRRVAVALHAAARAAAVNREWAATVSLLGLELEILRESGDSMLYAQTLLDRARIQVRLGEHLGAAADLMRASEVIGRMPDESLRSRADADRVAVEASLVSDPDDALPALTRAIEFHHSKGRMMFLPELLLQRGRAHAAAGDTQAAGHDFEEGIREIDAQRSSVDAAEVAWGTFAVAEELFDEMIGLAAKQGDVARALEFAERSRWRGAMKTRPSSSPLAASRDGEVVLEYAALPERLVIFVIDRDGVKLVQRDIARAQLARAVDDVISAALDDDRPAFRAAAAALYRSLVEPVAEETREATTLVFVPDATLNAVPFAALIDEGGRYVVEKHAVSVAPSLAQRRDEASAFPASPRLLLVEGSPRRAGESGRLSHARREADSVVAAYGRESDVLSGAADRTSFQSRAAAADVIHFVGHAAVPDASTDAALLTAGGAGGLGAEEIATMQFPRTAAVVLAACGTAQEWQAPGQTSISVARAFLAAGVPNVVATLWPIDDAAAAEFFPRLHSHLARGRSPLDALRATQLEWIQRPNAPPGMWAAVQVIGV